MGQNKLRKILSCLMAIVCAFCVVNLICFGYEHSVGIIATPNGVNRSIMRPHAVLVHGTEGYSITHIDRNGHANPNIELDESYVLMMGASHTVGKEVQESKRYSWLVNSALSENNSGGG